MSKSVTVRFNDGTSHVYDDVPDDVSDEQVQERASKDFNKSIEALGPKPMEGEEPGMGTKVMGAVQTAGQVLAPVAELYAGKKLVFDPLMEAIKNRGGPVNPAQMGQAVQTGAQATGTYGQTPRTPNLRVAPPSNAGAQAFEQMAQQVTRPQPQAPSMMQQGMDMFNKMRQIAAQRVMPAAGEMFSSASPYIKGAGGVAAALTPGNIGQNYGAQFPQAGPMRGMEINPNTNRPWTPQELAMYKQQYGG